MYWAYPFGINNFRRLSVNVTKNIQSYRVPKEYPQCCDALMVLIAYAQMPI